MVMPQASGSLLQELHGKYYTQTVSGNLFYATTLTASAIPIISATAATLCLWNPMGSGANAVLVRYVAGWNGTTEVPGAINLSYFANAGSTIATGNLVTAFTALTPQSGLLGAAPNLKGSQMKVGSAATITATANFIPLGISHLTTTGTATFGSFTVNYDFDGQLIIPPGTFVFPAASAASGSTYNQCLSWYETPAQ
jgi:hypothetical protein